jgi:hypothetical protein
MKHLYDKDYLETTLSELKANLDDLSAYSVYNDNRGLDEIFELKQEVKKVEAALTL